LQQTQSYDVKIDTETHGAISGLFLHLEPSKNPLNIQNTFIQFYTFICLWSGYWMTISSFYGIKFIYVQCLSAACHLFNA